MKPEWFSTSTRLARLKWGGPWLIGTVLIGLLWVTPAAAQITVEVLLEQEQFLPGEPLRAGVRVINRSGQRLQLGTQPDWLTFAVESRDGHVVGTRGTVPVLGEFELGPSQMGTKYVDLAPYFTLTRAGRYTVTATVRIAEWDRDFTSRPRAFEIIAGTKLWEQEVGVPQPAGGEPEVRKYLLQQANYLKQLRLYLRITDAMEVGTHRVLNLGPMVSFSRPEVQVDDASQAHILFQSGARTFLYHVVRPDGTIAVRQTYEFGQSRPRLRMDTEGKITVAGGVRRTSLDDIPATVGTNQPPVEPNAPER